MSKETASIRDQLGNNPDVTPVLVSDFDETLGVEEGPTQAKTNTLGNAWIVGSSTNGLVGANTATVGGGQQVVGGSGRVTTVVRVVNPNNTWNENFRDTDFESAATTADWNTASQYLTLTSATLMETKSIFLNSATVYNAKVIATGTNLSSAVFYVSADAGVNFETATNNESHSFTNLGKDLRLKITADGNVTATKLKVQYNIGV